MADDDDEPERFGMHHVYVPRDADAKRLRRVARNTRRMRDRGECASRSSRSAKRACVGDSCGTEEDIRCGFSRVTLGSFLPCMTTSLRALMSDASQLHALHMEKGQEDTWSRLSYVLLKNDRIFYLLTLVTAVVVLLTSFSAVRARISAPDTPIPVLPHAQRSPP